MELTQQRIDPDTDSRYILVTKALRPGLAPEPSQYGYINH